MARTPTQAVIDANTLDHETIAADIADFRKRGGRIEVLGNTPLRSFASSPFRTRPDQRKPPTPIKRTGSR